MGVYDGKPATPALVVTPPVMPGEGKRTPFTNNNTHHTTNENTQNHTTHQTQVRCAHSAAGQSNRHYTHTHTRADYFDDSAGH